MATTLDGKYFTDPGREQGTITVRTPGFQSRRAMTVAVRELGTRTELDTQVHGIKPDTAYTLSFWYRMPQEKMLSVVLFGQELLITKMFKYNPMHWCRYSATLNSGYYSGDVNIGFLVDRLTGEREVWLDKVELYEGISPIGRNVARLQCQYYSTAYVSPNAVAPLPFMFEWTFADPNRPSALRYVVEFPEGIEPLACALGRTCKAPADGWSITWTRPDRQSKVTRTPVAVAGKPYVRTVAHVKTVKADWKQLVDYVVPVSVNYWMVPHLDAGYNTLFVDASARWLTPTSGDTSWNSPYWNWADSR